MISAPFSETESATPISNTQTPKRLHSLLDQPPIPSTSTSTQSAPTPLNPQKEDSSLSLSPSFPPSPLFNDFLSTNCLLTVDYKTTGLHFLTFLHDGLGVKKFVGVLPVLQPSSVFYYLVSSGQQAKKYFTDERNVRIDGQEGYLIANWNITVHQFSKNVQTKIKLIQNDLSNMEKLQYQIIFLKKKLSKFENLTTANEIETHKKQVNLKCDTKIDEKKKQQLENGDNKNIKNKKGRKKRGPKSKKYCEKQESGIMYFEEYPKDANNHQNSQGKNKKETKKKKAMAKMNCKKVQHTKQTNRESQEKAHDQEQKGQSQTQKQDHTRTPDKKSVQVQQKIQQVDKSNEKEREKDREKDRSNSTQSQQLHSTKKQKTQISIIKQNIVPNQTQKQDIIDISDNDDQKKSKQSDSNNDSENKEDDKKNKHEDEKNKKVHLRYRKQNVGDKVRIDFENGDFYFGDVIENNIYHGQGKYFTKETGETYYGEWKHGVFQGFGQINDLQGNSFTGSFKKGERQGQGTQRYKNGQSYKGQFKNNLKYGFGTYYYLNKDQYIGYWKNDKCEGKGREVYADGSYFQGTWKNDEKDGFGFYMKNGKRYNQRWINGILIPQNQPKIPKPEKQQIPDQK